MCKIPVERYTRLVERWHHRRLVTELAALPEEERRAVIREADIEATRSGQSARVRPTLPWSALRSVIGIIHGEPADAVEDVNQLYDG